MSETVEVYKAADGWRWRAKAANGRIVADSGEGYHNRDDAVEEAQKILRPGLDVVIKKADG